MLAACSGGGDGVRVFAAASLTDVMTDLDAAFGGDIDPVVAGSSAVVRQVLDGADADVVITADEVAVQPLLEAAIVLLGPVRVAGTSLAIAVPAGNPAGVRSVADLGDLERVALCATAVPCGRVADRVLDGAGVSVPDATREANVRAALTKVRLGEVDAALVYATDVLAIGEDVQAVRIDDVAAATTYVAVALTDRGVDFVDWLSSPEATTVLRAAGFAA